MQTAHINGRKSLGVSFAGPSTSSPPATLMVTRLRRLARSTRDRQRRAQGATLADLAKSHKVSPQNHFAARRVLTFSPSRASLKP